MLNDIHCKRQILTFALSVKHERFFAQVYFSNVTVSQTTVSTEPMKIFRLKHETMRVCQTNVRFVYVMCRYDVSGWANYS